MRSASSARVMVVSSMDTSVSGAAEVRAQPGAAPGVPAAVRPACHSAATPTHGKASNRDRKSTRLNSSHVSISYAVFCLKKKKPQQSRILARYTKIDFFGKQEQVRVLDVTVSLAYNLPQLLEEFLFFFF